MTWQDAGSAVGSELNKTWGQTVLQRLTLYQNHHIQRAGCTWQGVGGAGLKKASS